MQSRNFRLQRVGDINWLEKNYKLQEISFALDEIMVVDASKTGKDISKFKDIVRRVVGDVFLPVTAGGGIRSLEDADCLINSGADKVLINSLLNHSVDAVKKIVEKYGSQAVIGSVDYKIISGRPVVFTNDGTEQIDMDFIEYLKNVESTGIGEIVINSIDKDGTGFGYDLHTINEVQSQLNVPLIAMGGAGNSSHMYEALSIPNVKAVATANLFNFVGDGLPKARNELLAKNVNLAVW